MSRYSTQTIIPINFWVGSVLSVVNTLTVAMVEIIAIVMIAALFIGKGHVDFGTRVIHAGSKIMLTIIIMYRNCVRYLTIATPAPHNVTPQTSPFQSPLVLVRTYFLHFVSLVTT